MKNLQLVMDGDALEVIPVNVASAATGFMTCLTIQRANTDVVGMGVIYLTIREPNKLIPNHYLNSMITPPRF
jgi:hypothetical protein